MVAVGGSCLRIAIISDTHFGDPLGTLVTASPKEPTPAIGPAYAPFARAVGHVDYLILLGDIIDSSVASYQEAYRHPRTFFRRLQEDQLAREIIYIPGNHTISTCGTQPSERRAFDLQLGLPHLYLVTGDGSSILLTHGHYLEAFWAFAAEWTKRLAFDDLDLEEDQELSLREMVGINLPLNQLACAGIGQAQPLAELARQIQREISAGQTSSLKNYFERFERSLRESSNLSWAKRMALSLAVGWGRKRFLAMLEGLEQTRYRTSSWTGSMDCRSPSATRVAGFSRKIAPLSISSGPKFSSTRAGQECDPCPFAAKTSIPSRRSKGGGKYEGRPFEAWGPDRTTPREGGA